MYWFQIETLKVKKSTENPLIYVVGTLHNYTFWLTSGSWDSAVRKLKWVTDT